MGKAKTKNAKAKTKLQKKKAGKTKGGGVTKKWIKIKVNKKTASKALGNTKPQPHMGKVSLKPAMKCGDFDTYGNLQKKNGQNKFDRDHVPSCGAMLKRAEELNLGPLDAAQKSKVKKAALAIAMPKSAHKSLSETYGGNNTTTRIAKDAKDLPAAAKSNIGKIRKGLNQHADAACQAKYKAASDKILKMTKKDYDNLILAQL